MHQNNLKVDLVLAVCRNAKEKAQSLTGTSEQQQLQL